MYKYIFIIIILMFKLLLTYLAIAELRSWNDWTKDKEWEGARGATGFDATMIVMGMTMVVAW